MHSPSARETTSKSAGKKGDGKLPLNWSQTDQWSNWAPKGKDTGKPKGKAKGGGGGLPLPAAIGPGGPAGLPPIPPPVPPAGRCSCRTADRRPTSGACRVGGLLGGLLLRGLGLGGVGHLNLGLLGHPLLLGQDRFHFPPLTLRRCTSPTAAVATRLASGASVIFDWKSTFFDTVR